MLNFINKKFWILKMPKFAILIFIAFNLLAMIFYPGGTITNPETIGYSFTQNFFSDLGNSISYSNESNTISFILFNFSLSLCGLTFIMLFYSIKSTLDSNILTSFATFFGILGGISCIGVALTPANLLLEPHIFFAHGIFRGLCIASVLYSILILKNNDIDNKYAYGFIIFGLMVLIYILISEFGPNPRLNPAALTLQVVSQKLIVFWLFISIYIYSIGLGKHLYSKS
jgi:hypothetical membrane protein